ncbi:MAG: hypothetical protein KAH48_01845 [Chlorobi bacterium]|nr:hypothetical protein [Chlorobiota bacterium]
MKLLRFVLPFLLILFIASCKTSDDKKSQITPRMAEIKVSWGEYYKKRNEISGYIVSDALIIKEEKRGGRKMFDTLGDVDTERYVPLLREIKDSILAIQALHDAGDTLRYLAYKDKKAGANLRFFWNPKYKAYATDAFRNIYDSLNALVPTK